jgi:hypothetical protein
MKRRVLRQPWIEGGAMVGMLIDGQRYRFLKAGVHVNERTGEPCDVAWYRINCADCETEMDIFTKVDSVWFHPSRRCSDCAQPGVVAGLTTPCA